MATTDTPVQQLIINKLTKAQYDTITPSDTELYFVTDDAGISSADVIAALGYTPYNGTTNPNGYITGAALSGYEQTTNKTTVLASTSTDTQYPSAKAVYTATNANATAISTINDKIPSQATSSNQLADKSFVNSSIATNTAYFIGTFNSVAELEAYSGTLTNNDYAFVATTDTAGNTLYDRYKYNSSTQEWAFEYELNNSSFTSNQWAAINSEITATSKVTRSGTVAVGSSTQPVYVNANGVVTTIGYTIQTSVPSGALFTDTTYSVMTGATTSAAGTSGLVPAPAAGDNTKYLRGDGTWAETSGLQYAMVVTDYTA